VNRILHLPEHSKQENWTNTMGSFSPAVGPLALSLLAAVACAAPAADAGGESPLTSSKGEGALIVVDLSPLGGGLPPGAVKAGQIVVQRVDADGEPTLVAANTQMQLPAGQYCLWTVIDGMHTPKNCDEVVTAGETTVHTLGVAEFRRSHTNDSILGVDWPSRAKAEDLGKLVAQGLLEHASKNVSFGIDDFRVRFQVEPATSGAIPTAKTIDLSSTEGLSFLRILPSNRADKLPYPDGAVGIHAGLHLMKPAAERETISVETLEDLKKPLLIRSSQPTSTALAYVACTQEGSRVSCPAVVDSIEPIALDPEGVNLQLGRLEQPKVKVQHGGSEVLVEGTYDVSLFHNPTDTHKPLYKDLPLGTGLDVLPTHYLGDKEYRVTIRYHHPDGRPVVQELDCKVTEEAQSCE
jgi:hypothetical protein